MKSGLGCRHRGHDFACLRHLSCNTLGSSRRQPLLFFADVLNFAARFVTILAPDIVSRRLFFVECQRFQKTDDSVPSLMQLGEL